ncbi:transposase [Burkholderia sola]
MRTRFTEEQIIGILKEVATDLKPAELCRNYGISEAIYHNRKTRFTGMTAPKRGSWAYIKKTRARRVRKYGSGLPRSASQAVTTDTMPPGRQCYHRSTSPHRPSSSGSC